MERTVDEAVLWLDRIARHRDRNAFAALFDRYAPQLKRYLMRSGVDGARADELVQDILLTVWHKADRYDARRAAPSTWIFTIARNRRIDALRRERHPEPDPDDPMVTPAPERAADAVADEARARDTLKSALAELPPDQARVLEGAYFEDKALSAIASELDVPLGTVKSRVRLALQRLRAALAPGEAP